MRVTVVGAGAIGGTTGVLLHQAGHDVTLVDRDAEHVAKINRDGFRISGLVETTERVPAVTASELPSFIDRTGPLGMVVLAVKAMDTEAAATQIRPYLAPDGFIVSYQNGLNEETIAKIVGPERTIGAFVHFGADLVEPGHVVLGTRPRTYISELDGRETPRIHEVAGVLSAVTEVEVTANLEGYLWGKLCYAALAFVVSSVDAPIDEVVMSPDARIAIRGAVAEVVDVARAQGIQLEDIHGFQPSLFDRHNPDLITDTDALFERWAEEGRMAIKRHMGIHRDIKVRKRRTEVDFQVAPVSQRGRTAGVPTPVTDQLVELIHQIEAGTRPQDWSAIVELSRLPAVPSA
ncbi:MAG TPA: ketopantoate reductase family protein [Thermomicrobiales bacterium]|nr:ketopantoate reductase family protein [Thermomicrobiales bacterium]